MILWGQDQWRNFGLKSEGDHAKVLTWCTYRVGGPSSHSKKWGVRTPPPKITPMSRICERGRF